MKRLIVSLFFVLCSTVLSAQSEKPNGAIVTAQNFTGTAGTYTGTLRNWRDVFLVNFRPDDYLVADLFIDANGNIYEITAKSAYQGGAMTVAVNWVGLGPPLRPSGNGVAYQASEKGLIPVMPDANGQISAYLQARILSHNVKITESFRTLADNTVGAAELQASGVTPGTYSSADITVDADGRVTAAANGVGGGGGGGSVVTDNTLSGNGSEGIPLKVDTTLIATRTWTETELNNRAEIQLTYYATTGVSSIALPDTPDANYPLKISRMGAVQSVDRGVDTGRDWRIQGSTITPKYRAISAGETIIIQYIKQQ